VLEGVTIENTGNGSSTSCVEASTAFLTLINVTVETSAPGSESVITANTSASIEIGTGCIIAGSANSALLAANGGNITQGANIALSGSPNYTIAFAFANTLGVIEVSGTVSFTGTGATGPRFLSVLNAVINTAGGGPNFYPGNSAGSFSSGGEYA
jgi:hypothetical protein